METTQQHRIHPLVAGAAASLMLVSLLGAAAITGILPTSHSTAAPTAAATPVADVKTAVAPVQQTAQYTEPAPAPQQRPVVHHKPQVRTVYVQQPAQVAQAPAQPAYSQPAPAPAAAPTSGVGIAAGAVIGGLLGNQVGGGNGRTLATIAGAVGGGYIGNEVEKRNR
jgi:uncharacterized protein YcfJ